MVQARGDGGSTYTQRAVFFPKGLGGRLYWYSLVPFHGVIFTGMANRITAAARAQTKKDVPTDENVPA